MSYFFSTNIWGQEVVNKDTISHNTAIKVFSDRGFTPSFNREKSIIKNVKVSGMQNIDSIAISDINT